MTTMTMEKRLSLCEDKLAGDELKLSNFIDTYIEEFGITRKTGLTLIARNFFTNYNEDSIRNHEGFKDYYFSIDYEERNRLKLLFKCMQKDILLEVAEESAKTYITVMLYHCPFERPEFFDLPYNESLSNFINAYIVGQINIKVTVEELLLRILEIETDTYAV